MGDWFGQSRHRRRYQQIHILERSRDRVSCNQQFAVGTNVFRRREFRRRLDTIP